MRNKTKFLDCDPRLIPEHVRIIQEGRGAHFISGFINQSTIHDEKTMFNLLKQIGIFSSRLGN